MAVVPTRICELVETFDRYIEAYRSQQYNETQLRREFIDPFFEELGWDVTNKAGYAQAYKDVIHEDAIKIGSATKAPDYCFRIGGSRKFFLEAKKPSVDIKGDPHPAYQLRRYAWSAKLPLSVLTDFEELAVYDCQIRPRQTDKADTARIMLFTYKDYLKKFSEIADIFSKEAILKGSFDKFAAATKGKRGTSTVDKEFLAEIEKWRNMLARIIALRNAALSVREINFCVQRTIDRILFLRMCEDRGIEPYGQLQSVSSGERTYPRLCEVFEKADQKYNSGLFYFHDEPDRAEGPDELTPNIIIDDKDLKWILHSLYYPQSPYEFSVLPAEILGNVYEQFLGKVITLSSAHRASVEDKPEVKKAGGVYYTPSYIVDYIVKNTVGKLCEGKTPSQIAKLKILDPACGSGSFLIGAYQYLLDWHLKYYTENEPEKHKKGKNPKIFETTSHLSEYVEESQTPHYGLTITEKKRILLNNIYGVDIDSQAVEVTKLSLLLKVLEGESSETIDNQYRLFHERALPDLANNIKCGNSLIGPDFYDNLEPDSITEELRQKINSFDWQAEFPDVFCRQNLGFDAVMGNPPYVRQETLGEFKQYFQTHYEVYHGTGDLYTYFMEKAVSLINKGGQFGYIVANKWMRANYGEPLRRWLKQRRIEEILDFGDLPVFESPTTYPCIIIICNNKPSPQFYATQVKTLEFQSLTEYDAEHAYHMQQDSLDDKGWTLTDMLTQELLEKIRGIGVPLVQYVRGKIFRGILTGLNQAFVIDSKTRDDFIREDPNTSEIIKPFLLGRDIKRYMPLEPKSFLIFIPKGWTRKHIGPSKKPWGWFSSNYPSIANHLKTFRALAEKRCDKGEYWRELRACDYYQEFEQPKIMLPDISLKGNFTLDNKGTMYSVNTSYIIGSFDKYLLAVLNSSLMNFFYKNLSSSYRGGYLRFIYQYMIQMAIKIIDFDNPVEVSKHGKIVTLVDRMLDLHE
jgi:type I restriction-modification system DNA methylase subunit